MAERIDLLKQLVQQTRAIESHLDRIKPNLEENDPALVEAFQKQVEQRAEILARFDRLVKDEGLPWSKEEMNFLKKLEEMEKKLQEEMNSLYAAFKHQINKLEQGKQASQKYGQAHVYSEGAFFDQRQ